MYGRTLAKACAFVGAATLAGMATAGPTGLMIMPIADILGHGEAYYTYSILGNERNVEKGYFHAHGVQFGLADRVEVGFDNDFFGSTTFNAKALLLDDKKSGRYALSFGLLNLGDRSGDMYLVGRYDLSKNCRFHCGYMQAGDNSAIIGFDGPVNWNRLKDCSWSAEHISGDDARTWFALNVPVKEVPGLSAMLGFGIPKEKSSGIQHMAVLTYGFRL